MTTDTPVRSRGAVIITAAAVLVVVVVSAVLLMAHQPANDPAASGSGCANTNTVAVNAQVRPQQALQSGSAPRRAKRTACAQRVGVCRGRYNRKPKGQRYRPCLTFRQQGNQGRRTLNVP